MAWAYWLIDIVLAIIAGAMWPIQPIFVVTLIVLMLGRIDSRQRLRGGA